LKALVDFRRQMLLQYRGNRPFGIDNLNTHSLIT